MAETTEILGIFDHGATAAAGARAVLDDGLGKVVAYSPVPNHALDQVLHTKISPIRTVVLIGGILGCATGFLFPIYTVLDWPMITGGKPLISIPPFVVIAFELTILFAAVGGMASFLWLAEVPRMTGSAAPDERFTNDKTGISVTCRPADADAVRASLERHGAEEVKG